jgi:hypothetical protein
MPARCYEIIINESSVIFFCTEVSKYICTILFPCSIYQFFYKKMILLNW